MPRAATEGGVDEVRAGGTRLRRMQSGLCPVEPRHIPGEDPDVGREGQGHGGDVVNHALQQNWLAIDRQAAPLLSWEDPGPALPNPRIFMP